MAPSRWRAVMIGWLCSLQAAYSFTSPLVVVRGTGASPLPCPRRQTLQMKMGFFDNLLGSNANTPSAPGVGARGLPAGWTEEVDPSSGDVYFYNAATGETTWDRPAAPKPTSPAPSAVNVPAVPRSYDEIHAQAIAAVKSGLKAGKRRLEVEFPPIAQTNKISDGSQSSQRLVRQANAAFNTKVASALSGENKRVVVLCADGPLLDEMLLQSLPPNAVCALIKDSASVVAAGDVVLSCQPADSKAWMASAQLANQAPVVVINGFQYNGYKAFDMAYYLKPMTFNSGICGYCLRAFPSEWTVWSTKTASPLDYEVEFVEAQGGCLRPDLQRISLKLTN